IPFHQFSIEALDGKRLCGKVDQLLRGSEKMSAEFVRDPKATLIGLAETVDSLTLVCLHEEFHERFSGVLVEEWPSLAAQIVSRGVSTLILDAENRSPFNAAIAANFMKLIKPLLPDRLLVTLPLDVNDLLEVDEWRLCTIRQFGDDPLKRLAIRKTQDDPLD
ncbi:hypothetical protein PMAYCL1PPCAC_14383, partial [Pristionchus mayeri]